MKPKAIIFDIDGTLADVEHRRHFVDGSMGKKDFNKFYEAMGGDGVHWDIAELLWMYDKRGYKVILCTGRPEKYRDITVCWFSRHFSSVYLDKASDKFKEPLMSHVKWHNPFEKLLMRPDDRQYEPDYLIKQDMLNELKKDYDIKLAVDDRDQVVKMWRDNGIRCLQVAEGIFRDER